MGLLKRKYKNLLIVGLVRATKFVLENPFVLGFASTIVLALIAALILWFSGSLEKAEEIFVDSILAGSVTMAVACIVGKMLWKTLMMISEDPLKLTIDYDSLAKHYGEGCGKYAETISRRFSLFRYDNVNSDPRNRSYARRESCCSIDGRLREMPIDVLAFDRNGLALEIEDFPDRRYRLPGYVESHFDAIFAGHGASIVSNNIVFRVDGASCSCGKVRLETSRSTYYDSLVTNRAADYRFCDGPTVREAFEYGNCLPSLSDSELSNHLGFNVNVVTSDDVVVLALRRKDVSVAKRLYCPAVGSPVRVRYATGKPSGKLTAAGVEDSVCAAIRDELALTREEVEAAKASRGLVLVAFYRDLVEGGKPQLLYNLRLAVDFRTLSDRMANRALYGPGDVHGADAGSVKGVRMDDLRHAFMVSDGMAVEVVGGGVEFLAMNPSYVFSTAVLLLDDVEVSDW